MQTVRALQNAWGVREYIVASVKRDFVSRYLGTQLGFFWAIAHPLALIVIYTVIFAEIMKPAMPGYTGPFAYGIYLCAGMIVWLLFNDLISRSVGIFVGNAALLKKVSLPKFALPAIVGLSALVNFGVMFVLFVAFLLVIGAFPGGALLAMVPVVTIVVALALGLGVLLGTINVFYRDVAQIAGLVLSFWFWLTPIVYPARAVPEWLGSILQWNPMWPLVRFTQVLFLEGIVADWNLLVYPSLVALALVGFGLHAYRKLGPEIADEL
ncbi:MAG TPA: ABC transporter permease [Casimicrobiaceae bacterium]|nr:ABC transporter permease [Casimicrobiaceae bacterium]